MPFLKPTHITDQETGPLVAFCKTAALLFSIRQSTVVCNKISSGETLLIRTMFFEKIKILKSQFECNVKMN